MNKKSWILKIIKRAGYSRTRQRAAVCSWVEKSHDIFSAKDIIRSLPGIDKVSVYRILGILKELNIIHPTIKDGDHQLYEVDKKEDHHHHIICVMCKRTKCVDCNFVAKAVQGFSSVSHSLVMTGLCGDCKD